jgi:putative membrane protein
MDEEQSGWPDYRFSLANERTFLAWVRTSVALLAGGAALLSVIPGLGPAWLQHVAGGILILLSTTVSLLAYRRWRDTDRAMREKRPLPAPYLLQIVSVGMVLLALLMLVMLVL